jgi:hypothetical protein
MACTDKKFVEHSEKCKDSFEADEEVTYPEKMSKSERKEQVRVMSNEWTTPTSEQEQIIASKVQIELIILFKIKKRVS